METKTFDEWAAGYEASQEQRLGGHELWDLCRVKPTSSVVNVGCGPAIGDQRIAQLGLIGKLTVVGAQAVLCPRSHFGVLILR